MQDYNGFQEPAAETGQTQGTMGTFDMGERSPSEVNDLRHGAIALAGMLPLIAIADGAAMLDSRIAEEHEFREITHRITNDIQKARMAVNNLISTYDAMDFATLEMARFQQRWEELALLEYEPGAGVPEGDLKEFEREFADTKQQVQDRLGKFSPKGRKWAEDRLQMLGNMLNQYFSESNEP
jgi:hypothetical protein